MLPEKATGGGGDMGRSGNASAQTSDTSVSQCLSRSARRWFPTPSNCVRVMVCSRRRTGGLDLDHSTLVVVTLGEGERDVLRGESLTIETAGLNASRSGHAFFLRVFVAPGSDDLVDGVFGG